MKEGEYYIRLNDPIAYGTTDESKETVMNRAYENLSIQNCDDKWLDFEMRDITDDEDKVVVYLRTLLLDEKDGVSILDRIENDAVEEIQGVEIGTKDYFSHLSNSYSVEDCFVSEERPDIMEQIIE